jgi:ferredoxin
MVALKQASLPVKAECRCGCLCSTCQVYVADDWLVHLPAKSDDEEMTLSEGWETKASSRPACQIEGDRRHGPSCGDNCADISIRC